MNMLFLSVAFGDERYLEQQKRLEASIEEIYPGQEYMSWTNNLPTGSKQHQISPYGFKVHAVKYALDRGYKKIIWFDPACILKTNVDYWFELTKKYGVVAAKDDNKLKPFCADYAYDYFGFNKDEDEEFRLVGGSVYVFDFENDLCKKIFDDWYQAEIDGIFENKIYAAYHRNDEACMALSLYKNGSKPVPYEQCAYNTNPNPVCTKIHFK